MNAFERASLRTWARLGLIKADIVPTWFVEHCKMTFDLLDHIDRLEAAEKRVRELHTKTLRGGIPFCQHCATVLTCPTIDALDDQPTDNKHRRGCREG